MSEQTARGPASPQRPDDTAEAERPPEDESADDRGGLSRLPGEPSRNSDLMRDGRPTAPWLLRAGAGWSWRIMVVGAAVYLLLLLAASVLFVVVALAAAFLLTALLSPINGLLRKTKMPRALASLLTVLLLILVIVAALYFVSRRTVGQFSELQQQLSAALDKIQAFLSDNLGVSADQLDKVQKDLLSLGGGVGGGLAAKVLTTAETVIEFASGVVLAIFVLFFFLRDGERLWGWTVRLFSPQVREHVDTAGRLAWHVLAGYVRGLVLVAFLDGLFIGVGLSLLGVPLALPLALLVFIGAFIPIVGSIVAGTAAVLVAYVSGGLTQGLITLGIVLLVNQLEGNVLHPIIQRRLTALHPLATVLAVAAGGALAGIFGALIAVPLLAVVATVTGYLGGLHRQRHAADYARMMPHGEPDSADADPS